MRALRFAIILSVAAAAALGLAAPRHQQAEPTVTLTVQAAKVTQVLAQLSTASQLQFTAAKATADDVLALRFKDVPIPEAMKRIAEAIDGTWRKQGDSYELFRTSDQLRAEREKEFGLDVKELSTGIRKIRESLGKMPEWSPYEADDLARRTRDLMAHSQGGAIHVESVRETPEVRVMSQIAVAMDPSELAALPLFSKTVWSSNPTQAQRPLSGAILSVVGSFLAQQAQWITAADAQGLRNSAGGFGNFWVGGFGDPSKLDAANVGVVLLSATRYGLSSPISLSLALYDLKGFLIGESQISVGGPDPDSLSSPKTASDHEDEPVLPFNNDLKTVLAALRGRGRAWDLYPRDLIERLTAPVQNDPLGILVSPELSALAELKGLNMVAALPDDSLFATLQASGTGIRVDRFLHNLEIHGTEAQIKDGWLVVKPTRPAEARESRADRAVLAAYLQRMLRPNPITLEETAYYSAHLPESQINDLAGGLGGVLHFRESGLSSRTIFKLYGLLDNRQKQAMLNGGLPLSDLNHQQQAVLDRLVYGPNVALQVNPERLKQSPPSVQQQLWQTLSTGLKREPTESLPNGFDPRAVLRLRSSEAAVVATDHNPVGLMDASSLAWAKYSQEHPDLFPWTRSPDQTVDFSKLEIGWRLQLTITIVLSPEVALIETVQGREDGAFSPVSMDSFPDAFKKQFDEAYDRLKRGFADAHPGQFTNSGVPPPP